MPRPRACSATQDAPDPVFTDTLELDLGYRRSIHGRSKTPEGRVALDRHRMLNIRRGTCKTEYKKTMDTSKRYKVAVAPNHDIGHGDVAIAAITSCTNTSNPSVMIAAGLVARNARANWA